MGKAGKWLRSFWTWKKEDKKEKAKTFSSTLLTETQSLANPPSSQKEKKRWSFRRSVGAGKSMNFSDLAVSAPTHRLSDIEMDQKQHAIVVAVATAAAADAAVAAAQAAAAAMCLTAPATNKPAIAVEEAAATKIQAAFRAHLARKALCALRGLVKLQALVRGHLVRKQAATTLRCMQALLTAQARVRAQRIRMVEESQVISQQEPNHRRLPQQPRPRQSYEMDKNMEENIKIVEMDLSGSRGNTKNRSNYQVVKSEMRDLRSSEYYGHRRTPSITEQHQQTSPAPSALTEMSPRAHSGRFEDFSFPTAQSSPQYLSAVSIPDTTQSYFDYSLFPKYMANTESSRAKARSQSAPRQRTETYERQWSRRRPSVEGRNIPKSVKMQRSTSQVGLTANGYQNPWSIKLDKSSISLQGSECGSTSTVLTNTNYCRSLVGFEVDRNKC